MQKLTVTLLLAGFGLCLLQVWWPAYYITGDGPCHLYNAQVLHDLWSGKNTGFYSRFFMVSHQLNPNWLTTLILALLLFIAKGVVAEKIYLSLYLILYITGFYLLLRKISNGVSAWPLVLFLFIFTTALAKGFYNFSFGIAFFFWMVWGWLRFLDRATAGRAALFFLFSLLSFFTHFLPFVFASFTCGALVASSALSGVSCGGKWRFLIKYLGLLALLLLPCMGFMGWFIHNEGGAHLSLRHHFYRLVELVQFKYIVNETHREEWFAAAAGVLLLLLSGISFFLYRPVFKVHKQDGFLAALLFILFVYLFFPEDVPGFLDMTMRVQLFVFILMACCIAYRLPAPTIKNMAAVILFVCFTALSMVRMSNRLVASRAVQDYLSAGRYINPLSVVLSLDFSPNGKGEHGQTIADRNWLFCHESAYLGVEKPLVILDNYEANMGYFPLTWVEKTNPYFHLSRDEGIEGQPPYALIDDYKQTSGVTIDYIIFWCYNPSYLQNGHFNKLYNEINAGYHLVYTSPTSRTLLYQKN